MMGNDMHHESLEVVFIVSALTPRKDGTLMQ